MGIHMNLWTSLESKETHGLSESIEINESMESMESHGIYGYQWNLWKSMEFIEI